MATIIFDIETGPLPVEQIEHVLGPFDPASVDCYDLEPQDFDESAVKYGNVKLADKRAAILQAAREEHAAQQATILADGPRLRQERILRAQAEHAAKLTEKAALSAVTGQVLAIGYKGQSRSLVIGEPDEPGILANFWQRYSQARTNGHRLVGFNIRGFDLPFLMRRSWVLGIDVPETVMGAGGRYFDQAVFVDLMDRWGCGATNDRIKLDTLAKTFGLPGKPDGINGGDFARLWAEDRERAICYLLTDLELTAGCAARMGIA